MQFGEQWVQPSCKVSEGLRSLLKYWKNSMHYLEKGVVIWHLFASSLRKETWCVQQLPSHAKSDVPYQQGEEDNGDQRGWGVEVGDGRTVELEAAHLDCGTKLKDISITSASATWRSVAMHSSKRGRDKERSAGGGCKCGHTAKWPWACCKGCNFRDHWFSAAISLNGWWLNGD